MRVLHVTTWYPNESNPHEAMWIKRHVCALEEFVSEQFVLHLEVRPSRKFRLKRARIDLGISTRVELPFPSWFLVELLTAFLLGFYLWRLRHRRFDLINFHIAYPTLVYWNWMNKWLKAK